MDTSSTRIAVSCAHGTVKLIRVKNMATEAVVPKPQLDQKDNGPGSSPPCSSLLTLSLLRLDMTLDAKYCAFDQAGETLAVVYSDNSLVFWNIEDVSDIQPLRIVPSHAGPISDMFPIPSCSSDHDSVDLNFPRRTRSPSIQDPQDIDSEFATCSDKGTINLWNLRLHRSSVRRMSQLSPSPEHSGRSTNNLKVEVGVNVSSVLTNTFLSFIGV